MRVAPGGPTNPMATTRRVGSAAEGGSSAGLPLYLQHHARARGALDTTTYDRTGQLIITAQQHDHSPSGQNRQVVARAMVRMEPVTDEDMLWLRQFDVQLYDYAQDVLSVYWFVMDVVESFDGSAHSRAQITALLSPALTTHLGGIPDTADEAWQSVLSMARQYSDPDFRQSLLEEAPVFHRRLVSKTEEV